MQEPYTPTPRERIKKLIEHTHGRDNASATRDLAEAQVHALLDVADAVRELAERLR